jgi:hypothetical protein
MGKKKSVLTDAQLALKQRVMDVYHRLYGFVFHHPNWKKNLWDMKTGDIYEMLMDRMDSTYDEVEYYACMVYLYHVIPDGELLVEFKDLQRIISNRTGICMDQKTTSKYVESNGVLSAVDGSMGVEVLGSVRVLGGF